MWVRKKFRTSIACARRGEKEVSRLPRLNKVCLTEKGAGGLIKRQ